MAPESLNQLVLERMYSNASAGEGVVAFAEVLGNSMEVEDQSVAAKIWRRAALLAVSVGRVMVLKVLEESSGIWKT